MSQRSRRQLPNGQNLGDPGALACHRRRDGGRGGYVNALINPDANLIAREVADNAAPGFVCRQDTALDYGLIGDDARE